LQGDLWWNTRTGQQFIFYDDGSTQQWVLANRGNGEAGDDGLNAFTTTKTAFVIPAVNNGVIIDVFDAELFAIGEVVYVTGAGYFTCYGVLPDQLGITNLGTPGNTAPGTGVPSGAKVFVSGPIGPVGPINNLTQGAGIILTPNPIVVAGQIAVDFSVVPHISDLGAYVHKAGDTMTGPLVVQMPGATSSYILIDQPGDPATNTNRPLLILSKHGVVVGQISADGTVAGAGAVYYEAIGAAPLHDFFVGGTLMFQILPAGVQSNGVLIATGSLVVGSNIAGVQHLLKMTNNATLGFYSDAAGEIVVDAFQSNTPTTKFWLNFNKYGGGSRFGAIVMNNTLTLSGTVAGNIRNIRFQTSGSDRWVIGPTFDAESGGNAGSTFHIDRFSDAGAFLGTVMSIDRPGGNIFFSGAVNAGSDLGGYALWSNPTAGAQAVVHWNVSGFVANAQKWQALNDGSKLRFQSTSDAGVLQNEIVLSRDGTMDVVAPAAADNSTKVPSTAWVRANAPNLGAYCMAFGTGSAIPIAIALIPLAAATLNQGGFLVGSRFTPPAGVYRVEASMGIVSATAAVGLVLTIRKNGVDYARGFDTASGVGTVGGVTVSVLVSMNGTDFVEPFWSAGSAQTGDVISTYFNAQKVA
jgi:hypothetical protein